MNTLPYHKFPFNGGIVRALLSTAVVLYLSGCAPEDKKAKASNDVNALQQLVAMPTELKSARWEMFGTPEYEGGVPGRTDYMTLVAEIEPITPAEIFASGANDKAIYVVPEAARPWLSGQFRSMLEKNKNTNIDLAAAAGCHVYDTTIKTSGRKVSGFSCEKSGKVLLYLSMF